MDDYITVLLNDLEDRAGQFLPGEYYQAANRESAALQALENGDTSDLPGQYWICLVCGDTFKSLEGVEACPLCGTKAEKFLVIG